MCIAEAAQIVAAHEEQCDVGKSWISVRGHFTEQRQLDFYLKLKPAEDREFLNVTGKAQLLPELTTNILQMVGIRIKVRTFQTKNKTVILECHVSSVKMDSNRHATL